MRVIRGLFFFVCAAVACACGGNPVSSTPPPTPIDPPKITCPAPVSQTSPNGLPVPISYGTPTVALGKAPISTSCTPASGTSFPLGPTTVTCVATDALQRTDTCTFTVTVASPPRISATRFVAFGDSITWGENGQASLTSSSLTLGPIRPAVQVSTPYPSALQLLLSARYATQSISVQNSGCPGEMAEPNNNPPDCAGGLQAVTRFANVVGGGSFQGVLLMEGANDVAEQLSLGGSTAPVDAAISALQTMVDYAKSRNVRPYLATITPENYFGTTPARRGGAANFVPPFNDRVRALASAEGITLVDVYAAFTTAYPDPATSPLIGPDGLHPTQAGYNAIAQAFFDSLKSTLEATPSSLPRIGAPVSFPGRAGSSGTKAAAGPGSLAAARKPR